MSLLHRKMFVVDEHVLLACSGYQHVLEFRRVVSQMLAADEQVVGWMGRQAGGQARRRIVVQERRQRHAGWQAHV